jgi:hypothetical protein
MVCRIADNPALESMRKDLGLERFCHSQRVDCIHRLPRASDPSYYGISGAFMGYCQALFERKGTPAENTVRVAELLTEAALPWARSHELFLGHRTVESVESFVQQAAQPLSDLGRVPILITGLDTSNDAAVSEILDAPVDVVDGETVLVRLVLNHPSSFAAAANVIEKLVRQAEATRAMPKWWPLLQAAGQAAEWSSLKERLGGLWKFVNIGVNPFTDAETRSVVEDQVMVAQFFVPGPDDITHDGDVRVSEGMTIYGAKTGDRYSIPEMVEQIADFPSWPTCIFLGPTLPAWSDEINVLRVQAAVDAFCRRSRQLWERDGLARYEPIWQMAA